MAAHLTEDDRQARLRAAAGEALDALLGVYELAGDELTSADQDHISAARNVCWRIVEGGE
jgi:hypothetical protein